MSPSPTLRLGTALDDAPIRDFLARESMAGPLTLGFSAEPSYFGSLATEGDRHVLATAWDDERLVGLGTRSVRMRYVSGGPARIGYLGHFRVDRDFRHCLGTVARSFDLLDASRQPGEAPYDFTSILQGNRAAHDFLRSGWRRLPRYTPLCDIEVLNLVRLRRPIPKCPDLVISRASGDDAGVLDFFLDKENRHKALYPVWSMSPEVHGSPPLEDTWIARKGQDIVGCLALWDQTLLKQTHVVGYPGSLRYLRPVVNAIHPLFSGRRLPAVGTPVPLAHLSHVAITGNDPRIFLGLVHEIWKARPDRILSLGLQMGHPLLAAVQQTFSCLKTGSRLYLVSRDPPPENLLQSLRADCHPEVGTL